MQKALRLIDTRGDPLLRCGHEPTSRPGRRQVCQRQLALNYLVSGSGWYRDDRDGTEYSLRPGSFYLRIPGQPHTVELAETPAAEIWYLAVPAAVYSLFRSSHILPANHACVFQAGVQASILAEFDAICQALMLQPEAELGVVLLRMQNFMFYLIQEGSQGEEQKRQRDTVAMGCRLLEEDLASRTPLREIARAVGCSYSHFRHCFQQRLGLSPGQYRIRRRIELAQSLLSDPLQSIKSVADRLGYPEVYTFSRQFRQITGQPPGRYRRGVKEGNL